MHADAMGPPIEWDRRVVWRAEAGGGAGNANVEQRIIEQPEPVKAGHRRPCEHASDSNGLYDLVRSIGYREPSGSDADDATFNDCG